MTWYHPALAQRALDDGDREIEALRNQIKYLRNALKSIDDIAVSKKAGAAKGMQEVARTALAHSNGER